MSKRGKGKNPEQPPGQWRTPENLAAFGEREIVLLFGGIRLALSGVSLNLHQIDSVTRRHSHDQHQLIYYRRGSGSQLIGKERFSVVPRSVFLVPPGMEHHFYPKKGSSAEVFSLQLAISLDLPGRAGYDRLDEDSKRLASLCYSPRPSMFVLGDENAAEAERLAGELSDCLDAAPFGVTLRANGLLLLILQILFSAAVDNTPDRTSPKRDELIWLRLKGMIERQADNTPSLGEAAERCHVSSSYVQKIFSKFAGTSYSDFCQRTRLSRAEELMADNSLSIKEIAYKCGMSDANYFSRLFRKLYGCTPKQYRTELSQTTGKKSR